MTILILFVLGLLSLSSGQFVSKGYCQLPEPVNDYEESKVLGNWYEGWRVNSTYEANFECTQAQFVEHKNGYMTVNVNAFGRLAGVEMSWVGTFIPKNSCPVNEYFVKFPRHSQDPGVDAVFPAADWNSWVIAYGCYQQGHYKKEYIWIYVKDLDNCDEDAIDDALNEMGFCLDDLIRVNYSDCP